MPIKVRLFYTTTKFRSFSKLSISNLLNFLTESLIPQSSSTPTISCHKGLEGGHLGVELDTSALEKKIEHEREYRLEREHETWGKDER